MTTNTPLIATISIGFVLALIFGGVANRLKLSPLVGYLLAGICVGPYTPFFVADAHLSHEISEIGVILLMFGVGLHFSLKDLMSVKHIAIPGAIAQIVLATLMGLGLSWCIGYWQNSSIQEGPSWGLGSGLVFGLALSVASTVVLLRALEARQLIDSRRGKIAVGWLIVEDLVMVLALVLIPALSGVLGGKVDASAGQISIGYQILLTLGKVALFIIIMIVVGRKAIPWVLERIAGTGSRELFTLSVLAIALGIAYGSSELFGVSFALGAFFAGMILNESELSHKAAEDSLPFRDAFAVLFFVSVGMLFDPHVLIEHPILVIATLLIIIVGKSIAALIIVLEFKKPLITALTISVSLAQIGEFSFIIADIGMRYELLPKLGHNLILAGAILSILLNPILFLWVDRLQHKQEKKEQEMHDAQHNTNATDIEDDDLPTMMTITDHAVIVGFGIVGQLLVERLQKDAIPFVIIEDNHPCVDKIAALNLPVIEGNAVNNALLERANIKEARWLLVTIDNALETGQIISHARLINLQIEVMACAKTEAEQRYLMEHGANLAVIGKHEIANVMEIKLSSSKYTVNYTQQPQ